MCRQELQLPLLLLWLLVLLLALAALLPLATLLPWAGLLPQPQAMLSPWVLGVVVVLVGLLLSCRHWPACPACRHWPAHHFLARKRGIPDRHPGMGWRTPSNSAEHLWKLFACRNPGPWPGPIRNQPIHGAN
jgi:hypothetical protein